MPAVITVDKGGRRMQMEREGDRLLMSITNGGVTCHGRLDVDDARAVRRYLSQWLRWLDYQDGEAAPDA